MTQDTDLAVMPAEAEPPAWPAPGAPSGRGVARIVALTVAALTALTGAVVALTAVSSQRVMQAGEPKVLAPEGARALVSESNTPTVARNPHEPANLVVSNRIDRPVYSAALHWSVDGGATWSISTPPLPAGRVSPYAPDIAFAADGTLYVVYVNLHPPANDPENLWLARSTDGGRTLSDPVHLGGPLAFQPRLAVDAQGTIVVTWLQGGRTGTLSLVGPPAPIVAAHSSDGGRTFSTPIQVSDASRQRVGGASPVFASDGSLVVLYEDFKSDVRDFQNLDGPPWPGPLALVITRSTDRGATFARGVEVDSGLVPTERFLVYLPIFPSLAAGPNGDLVVTWSDGRDGDAQVFLRRSTDMGGTWTDPVVVSDHPPHDGSAQWLPTVGVAPNGRIDLVFLDRRKPGDGGRTDAVLASSDDNGHTFTSHRLTTSPFDTRIGPMAGPSYLHPDQGSRLALLASDTTDIAAWADTGLGSVDTGRQDVVMAQAINTKEWAHTVRLLVAAGFEFVALAILVRWIIVSRRQTTPQFSITAQGQPERLR